MSFKVWGHYFLMLWPISNFVVMWPRTTKDSVSEDPFRIYCELGNLSAIIYFRKYTQADVPVIVYGYQFHFIRVFSKCTKFAMLKFLYFIRGEVQNKFSNKVICSEDWTLERLWCLSSWMNHHKISRDARVTRSHSFQW